MLECYLHKKERGGDMALFKLLRIKHWIKNILIFVPCFFGIKLFDPSTIYQTLIGALSFSLMSSVIYIINDLYDYEKDRKHPYKCKRPIASGAISKNKAKVIAAITMLISIALLWIANSHNFLKNATLVYILYFLLNILYSVFKMKNIPLFDVCILASGFVLRVFFGAFLNNIVISSWLYLVIVFGALYLGLAKRRGELKDPKTTEKRYVLKYYSFDFLNQNMYMALTISIVFYALWCAENPQYPGVLWSIPILATIILRYNFLVEQETSSGDPVEVISKDLPILLLGIVFVVYLFGVIYMNGV